MIFQKYNALKIIILLALGVSINFIGFAQNIVYIIAYFSAFIVVSFSIYYKSYKYFSLLWISIGMNYSVFLNNPGFLNESFKVKSKSIIEGEILKKVYSDSLFENFIAEGDIYINDFKKNFNGRILVTIPKTESKISVGNKVIIFGDAESISQMNLPNEKASVFSSLSENINLRMYAKLYNIKIIENSKNLNYYLDILRKKIKNQLEKIIPPEIFNYSFSVVSGDLSLIPKEEKRLYSLTGTIHILNVSGLHIAIFAFILFELLAIFKNKKIKFGVFIVTISFFVIITGMQPPGVRAGIVAVLYYFVFLKERRVNFFNLLLFSAIFFFLINPNVIFSVSFQMSFAATLSLVVFYPILYAKFKLDSLWLKKHFILRSVISSILVTISAGILLNPLIAYYFGIFSLISYIANVIIVPLYNLFIIFTFLGLILSFVSIYIGQLIGLTSLLLIKTVKIFIFYFANLDYAYFFSEKLVIYDLILSFSIILLIYSENLKNLIFRAIYIIFFVALYYTFFEKDENYQSFHRNDYSIFKINEKNNTLLIIEDEMPFLYTKGDKKAIEFLTDFINKEKCYLIWNGNNGMIIKDKLKEKFNLSDYYLSKQNIELLKNLITKSYDKN